MMFSYTVKTIPPLICGGKSICARTDIQLNYSPPIA